MKHTIFDDVFRTMLAKLPQLMIPFVNEVFHCSYPEDVAVTQLRNEHLQEKGKVITDSCLLIGDSRYHMECQSTDDPTMAFRMFVYDVSIARESTRRQERTYRVFFPYSCVLYLRSTKKTPDLLETKLILQNGTVCLYTVPAVKLSGYSRKMIFDKNLFLLLPFYALRYEKQAQSINEDPQQLQMVLKEYREIREELERRFATEEKVNFYLDLSRLIVKVTDYVFRKADKVRKGVEKIMRGKVLELESERLLAVGEARGRKWGEEIGEARGRKRGEEIGEARGRKWGEERLSVLIQHLILDGKSDKIQEVVTKPEIRNRFYKEYGL